MTRSRGGAIAIEACWYRARSEKVWPTLAALSARMEAKDNAREIARRRGDRSIGVTAGLGLARLGNERIRETRRRQAAGRYSAAGNGRLR
jgi:hypothetical protein